MKLDEKRLRYPHNEGEELITDKDFNPDYDLRVDLSSRVGKAGEYIDVPPHPSKISKRWILLAVMGGLIASGCFWTLIAWLMSR